MSSLQKYTNGWGESGLVRFPQNLLVPLDIPEEAKRFLIEIGLPVRSHIPLGSSFVPLPTTSAVAASPHLEPMFLHRYSTSPYLILGLVDYDPEFGQRSYFCIKEKTGTIHLLDDQDPTIFLVNSSLPPFVDSLLCYHTYLEVEPANTSSRNEALLLKELRQNLRAIDDTTFKRRSTYWPIMLADLVVQI